MNEYEMNKRQVEALIKSGAFDGLGARRSQLIDAYEGMIDTLHEKKRSGVSGQLDMFGAALGTDDAAKAPEFVYPDIPELSRRRLLELERQVSGMYFSGHILDDYENELTKIKPMPILSFKSQTADDDDTDGEPIEVTVYSDHDKVTVAGLVTKRVVKETKKGDKMMFVTLEDKTGDIEIVIFPKQTAKFSHLFYGEEPLIIKGELSIEEDGEPRILCSFASLLTEYDPEPDIKRAEIKAKRDAEKEASLANSIPKRLYVRVEDANADSFRRVSGLIEVFCGNLPVFIYDKKTEKYLRFEACGADITSQRLISELKKLLGDENVVLK